MEIKKIFIAGAGLMGSGIAQVSAATGYQVLLWDINEDLLAKAIKNMENALQKRIDKGKMTPHQKEEILGNIETVTDLAEASQAQLVIEAVLENIEIKSDLFKKLDQICPPETIFASNTSALPISSLANAVERPDRFIGLHFFSPVPVMKLVEIVKGLKTSAQTFEISKAFIAHIGKTGIKVKDTP